MDDILSLFFPELKEKGVDYDDLTPDEKNSYLQLLKIQESGQINLEQFQQHISRMRQSVELELVKLLEKSERHTLLKARLYNYILFEAFFEKPQRAKELIEQYKRKV